VVDATFLDPVDRETVERFPRPPFVPFVGLWFCAAPDILRQRVADRHGGASDADLRVLAEQLSTDAGPIAWHRIDVSGDYATCLKVLSKILFEKRNNSDSVV
jgi:predicted kinase